MLDPLVPEHGSTGQQSLDGKSLDLLVSTWQKLNLPQLKQKLESDCSIILDAQKKSQDGRKQLIELTKGFKKSKDEERMSNVAILVKAYQREIDEITKRCLNSEKAALEVFYKLSQVGDPTSALSSALTLEARCKSLEKENAKLQSTLNQYQESMDAYISESIDRKQAEWESQICQPLREEIGILKANLEASRLSLTKLQQQLTEESAKVDRIVTSRHTEQELIASELYRAQLRIAELEALKQTGVGEIDLRSQQADHEREVLSLLRQVDDQKQRVAQLERAQHQNEAQQTKRIAALEVELRDCHELIEKTKDYEKVARELEALKESVLGSDTDSASTALSPENGGTDGSSAKRTSLPANSSGLTLEQLFRAKNIKLEGENKALKGRCSDAEAQRDAMSSKLSTLLEELEHQAKLVRKLEEDVSVLSANQHSLGPHTLNGRQENKYASGNANASTDEFMASLYQSLTAPKDEKPGEANAKSEPKVDPPPDKSQNLVSILARQRDRYRQRVSELEESNSAHAGELVLYKSQLESYQKDNIKLYEKIRFLESNAKAGDSFSPMVQTGAKDVESRYRPLYEDHIDPFKSFQRHVSTLFFLVFVALDTRFCQSLCLFYTSARANTTKLEKISLAGGNSKNEIAQQGRAGFTLFYQTFILKSLPASILCLLLCWTSPSDANGHVQGFNLGVPSRL